MGMAIREYACCLCGLVFDRIGTDAEIVECKNCGADAYRNHFPLPAQTPVGKYGKGGGREWKG